MTYFLFRKPTPLSFHENFFPPVYQCMYGTRDAFFHLKWFFSIYFSFFYVPHTKNAVGCQDMIVGPNSSRSIKVTLFPFRLHFWTTSTIFHDGRCRPASTFRPARCWTYLDANAGIEFRIRKEADSTLNLFVSVFFIFSSPGSFIFRYRLCAILAYRLNGARYRTFEFIWMLETSPLFSHDGRRRKRCRLPRSVDPSVRHSSGSEIVGWLIISRLQADQKDRADGETNVWRICCGRP